jgi:DNA-binding CsgD family transcriptional regulator
MGNTAPQEQLSLTQRERAVLQDLAAADGGRSPASRRARIIIMIADGLSTPEICRAVGCSHQTVGAWRQRFAKSRLEGVHMARRG